MWRPGATFILLLFLCLCGSGCFAILPADSGKVTADATILAEGTPAQRTVAEVGLGMGQRAPNKPVARMMLMPTCFHSGEPP